MEKPPADEYRRPNEGRLDSWKKIAVYLKRDVTTVQRWEKREGMPVHRQLHDKMGSVYALRAELDAWTHSRRTGGVGPATTALFTRRRSMLLGVLAAATLLVAVLVVRRFEAQDAFWKNPIADAK